MSNGQDERQRIAHSIQRVVNIVRVVAVIVLVAIAATGVVRLVRFYSRDVGLSAPRAIETYVRALYEGDANTVYNMTDPDSLVDLYGAPVDRLSFMQQVSALRGDAAPAITSVYTKRLFESKDTFYCIVELTLAEGRASRRFLLETRNMDGRWVMTWPFGLTR